jgi:hypothetical protein
MIDGDRASAVHQEIDGGRDPHRREFRGRGPRPNDDGRLSTPGPRIQFAPLNFRKTIRERFPAALPQDRKGKGERGRCQLARSYGGRVVCFRLLGGRGSVRFKLREFRICNETHPHAHGCARPRGGAAARGRRAGPAKSYFLAKMAAALPD